MNSEQIAVSPLEATVPLFGSPAAEDASAFRLTAATLSSWNQAALVAVDLLSIWAVALFAIAFRFPHPAAGYSPEEGVAIETHLAFLGLYSGLLTLAANSQHLYSRFGLPSLRRDAAALLKATFIAGFLLSGFLYLARIQTVSRTVVVSTLVVSFPALLSWRCLRRRWLRTAAADGVSCHNALIAGSNSGAELVRAYLAQHRELGLSVKGVLTDPHDDPTLTAGALGRSDDLEHLAQSHFIDELIICTQDRELVRSLIQRAQRCGLSVRVIPDLYDGLAVGAPIDYLGAIPSLYLHRKRIPAAALAAKRLVDILLSGAALLMLSPLLLLVAALVLLDSPGPVLYISQRVGRKGRIFSCCKFRTMVTDAEQLKARLQHLNERDGILFKISNDPRVTRLGRYLRKFSLDELAQLWNVFLGDMSLVGPRPPLASEVEKYQLEHLRRLEVAPGITGLWQVEARANPSFDRYIELDLQYVREWSLLLDLKIVLKTIAVVVAGTGQ